tara:strand:+ start:21 stop:896 length:876 start_codon:yes stop_codon:yes gene_type:complete
MICEIRKPRVVCWYSHGAASLVAAKIAISEADVEYPGHEIIVACIYLENEYHEPERLESVEEYLGLKLTILRDEKYSANVDTVIEKTRYMSGVSGARCTKELKKKVRLDWQRDDDIHVFGMSCDETDRIDNLIDHEPELLLWSPLIDHNLSKESCFRIMKENDIELPMMYKLGFHNNNCIGCVKASGAGYWNKIREHFPDVFETRAKQEKMLGVSLICMGKKKVENKHPEVLVNMSNDGYEPKIKKYTNKKGYTHESLRIPLRYLPVDAGSFKDLDIGDCGFFCETKEVNS